MSAAARDSDDGDLGPGHGTLLALTQYAIAEESVAEGLQRLAATAEPVDAANAGDSGDSASDDSASGDGASGRAAGPATPSSMTASARPWRRSPTTASPC